MDKAKSSKPPDDSDEDFFPTLGSTSDSDWVPPSLSEDSDIDSIVFPLLYSGADSGSNAGTSKEHHVDSGEQNCGTEIGKMRREQDVQVGREQDVQVGREQDVQVGQAVTEELGVHLSQRGEGKYKWNKKHACKFCSKIVLKMSTHLQDLHANEAEVAKILSMTKGSKARRVEWIKLQDQGDYMHNCAVLESKSGCVIPKYRTKGGKVDDLVACTHCKGLYQKKLISIHWKQCNQKPEKALFTKRGDAARLGRLMLPIPVDVDASFYHKVLARQRDDEIRQLISTDSLLLEYGKRLFDRRDIEEHTAGQISCRMRELGRLLKILRVRSETKIQKLNDVINSASFDLLVLAVKELAEFDENTHQFKKGHLAMRIGHALKKCSQIKQSNASKHLGQGADEQWQQELSDAVRFDSVFTGDWYDCISATAAQSVGRTTMNKPKLIPSCEDVTKVQQLLETKMISEDYPTVVKATLCAISLFNRKRGGELQRMKVSDFQNAKVGTVANQDILKGLTEVEKRMVKHFQRVEIRGKFNRSVPILLTKKMMKAIEKILQMRLSVPGVACSPYIFATPSGQRPYRGHDVLKEHALEAQVSNPGMFTFTQLRKQLATLAQSLAISELDQDQLADFLGHDIRIHRHIYRQPQDILQKAKVAKILLSVNNGMTDFETCIRQELDDEEIDFDEHTSGTCTEATTKIPRANKDSARSKTRKSAKTRKRGCPATESFSTSDDDDDTATSAPVQKKANLSMSCDSKAEKEVVETSFRAEDSKESPRTTKRRCATDESDDDDDTTTSAYVQKKAKFSRRPWGRDEEEVVKTRFRANFVMNKIPGKAEIEQAIAEEPALKHRRWTNIKDYIRNKLKKVQSK